MSNTPIRLVELSKEFRLGVRRLRHLALDRVDLEVHAGETLGLLGPNGAGKTTTLKLILGLIFPTGGRVELFGSSPQNPAVRRRLGFLPENPYFYDYLTGREFLHHSAQLCGLSGSTTRERAAALLDRVRLTEAADRALRKYSKGMTQRLGLAQALIHQPELVILDEPMSGLDPLGRREVRDLILDLRRSGCTVLFSSHVLSDVEAICDRVVILDKGRITATGQLAELLAGRAAGVELTVAEASPELRQKLAALGAQLTEVGQILAARLGDLERQGEALAAVTEHQGRLLTLTPVRSSLEEIFLDQIGEGG